jgi:hypothetical protein
MFAGWARVGGLFTPLVTVIVKSFVSFDASELAVTEAEKVPEFVAEGARWMFPVRVVPAWALSVLVMNVGPVWVNVIASPSGSVAVKAWSAVVPAVTVMLLIAVSTTGRSTLITVIVSDFSLKRPPVSVARTVAIAVPASEKPGAKAIFPVPVPVPAEVVVTVM